MIGYRNGSLHLQVYITHILYQLRRKRYTDILWSNFLMWLHLCALKIISTYRLESDKVIFPISELNIFSSAVCLSSCRVCPPSALLSIHSPPLPAFCSTSKPVAQLERQPGLERWYPPANKRLLCTRCSLPASPDRFHPAPASEIYCPAQTNKWRVGVWVKYRCHTVSVCSCYFWSLHRCLFLYTCMYFMMYKSLHACTYMAAYYGTKTIFLIVD